MEDTKPMEIKLQPNRGVNEGNIDFVCRGGQDPLLSLRANGDIFVRGKLAENDTQVVDSMRRLLGGVPTSFGLSKNLLARVKDRAGSLERAMEEGDIEAAVRWSSMMDGWYMLACDLCPSDVSQAIYDVFAPLKGRLMEKVKERTEKFDELQQEAANSEANYLEADKTSSEIFDMKRSRLLVSHRLLAVLCLNPEFPEACRVPTGLLRDAIAECDPVSAKLLRDGVNVVVVKHALEAEIAKFDPPVPGMVEEGEG